MNGFPPTPSLWWSWTAPSSEDVLITSLAGEPMFINAFTGTDLATLTPVDGANGVRTSVRFAAFAGTTYQLRSTVIVGGRCDVTPFDHGDVVLQIRRPPANDDFAGRILLEGLPAVGMENNLGATAEPGEPMHFGRLTSASLWWSWTSPVNGSVTVDALGSEFGTEVAVYIGTSLDSLQPVAAGDDAVTFPATAGTTYQIALDPRGASTASGRGEIVILSTP
jgi:hypothetical protein